jgi:voltage-gated potassium channel Kch
LVAFVWRHPRLGTRTVVFAFVAFVEVAAAFGVFYRALPEQFFHAPIRSDFDAIYFSVITFATVGYGDVHPARDAGWAHAIVVVEVGVGLYFLAGLFATMVSWASAVPALPTLEQLLAECPSAESQRAAQQAAAPDDRATNGSGRG